MPLRWKRRQIGELVCDRDTPFTEDDEALLEAIAHHAAVALEHGRAVMRGVLAQEIHHRVKNNLQAVASLLRLQARADTSTPRKALQDSVNRILAIAAVHEVLTEHREDDVDLGELVDRLRAMLVQGLVEGKDVTADVVPISLAGQRATALALVFTELLQNALEHGGSHVSIALARGGRRRPADDRRRRRRSCDGDGSDGTGLSIVRALVRDELHGTFELDVERRHSARSRSRMSVECERRPVVEMTTPSTGGAIDPVSYTFVLLRRGPRAVEYDEETLDRLQAAHLAFLDDMRERGHLLVAGPFDDQEDETLRGFCIYCTGLEETRALVRDDPSVQAGRMAADVMTWLTHRGHVAFPHAETTGARPRLGPCASSSPKTRRSSGST